MYVGPELQDAFQVASTPEHLRHRYLVWNDVGIIVAHDVEDEPATINIGAGCIGGLISL